MLKPCHLLTFHKRTEMKLYLNFRDKLLVLETTEIAYIEASGNYSCILFMKGGKKLLAMTLSKLESLICLSSEEISSKFVRIGRSLIINQDYLTCVNLIKEEIVLSDYNNHIYTLPVSKFLLKKYKSRFFFFIIGRMKNISNAILINSHTNQSSSHINRLEIFSVQFLLLTLS